MTPFSKVYTAFLARILEDEWQQWMYDEAEQDWRQLMENALTWFKFPRVSLEHDEDGFVETGFFLTGLINTFNMLIWIIQDEDETIV